MQFHVAKILFYIFYIVKENSNCMLFICDVIFLCFFYYYKTAKNIVLQYEDSLY